MGRSIQSFNIPTGKPRAFDCRPGPWNGEFEPCLGKMEFEPEAE